MKIVHVNHYEIPLLPLNCALVTIQCVQQCKRYLKCEQQVK